MRIAAGEGCCHTWREGVLRWREDGIFVGEIGTPPSRNRENALP